MYFADSRICAVVVVAQPEANNGTVKLHSGPSNELHISAIWVSSKKTREQFQHTNTQNTDT